MKKVLVAGASGGMGYALVNELTSRGLTVTSYRDGIRKTMEWVKEINR